jgi:hypothetical protein
MSWSLLWSAGCFVAFAFLPITLPLAFLLGCPSYGHVIVLYFLAASLPSFLLAIGEGLVDKRGTEAWGEWIGSYSQGLSPITPEVRAFRPHRWGKWGAIALAAVGALLTLVGVLMFPKEALQFVFSNPNGSGRGESIVGLMVVVLGGPAAGGFIGYAYGIHLGAIADIVLRVAVRTKDAAKRSNVAKVET